MGQQIVLDSSQRPISGSDRTAFCHSDFDGCQSAALHDGPCPDWVALAIVGLLNPVGPSRIERAMAAIDPPSVKDPLGLLPSSAAVPTAGPTERSG